MPVAWDIERFVAKPRDLRLLRGPNETARSFAGFLPALNS